MHKRKASTKSIPDNKSKTLFRYPQMQSICEWLVLIPKTTVYSQQELLF